MKRLIISAIMAIASVSANAQTEKHFEIETDPIAFALSGGSGHAAFAWKNERVQLGYGQLKIPKAIQNHENLSESFKSVSLKWDYFFGKHNANQGFFAGPTVDFMFLKYEDEFSETYKETQFNLGVRGGYKFDLFKKSKALNGLYVTPWVGVSTLTKSKDIELSGKTYSRKAIMVFPTVHVGWSF